MSGYVENIHFVILLVGILVGLSFLFKSILTRIHVSPLAGWIFLGVLCSILGKKWGFLDANTEGILEFLAEVGVITLLFKVGMESKIGMLSRQLKNASLIWAGNLVVSGLFGYLASYYLCGFSPQLSLIIGVAFTATSVGVAVKTWEDAGQLRTSNGQLLLDLAEMDDVSAIILMGFLFAVIPVLQGASSQEFGLVLGKTALIFMLRITLFIAFCLVFARFFEKPLMRFLVSLEYGPEPILTVAAIGFIIAGVAGILDFSVALGAFFAGLAFSGDQKIVRKETLFNPIYEFFTPFFFIGIGLAVRPSGLTAVLFLAGILFMAAFAGKVGGTMLPALPKLKWKTGLILGISMVPRAEITMIIMSRAHSAYGKLVSSQIYSAVVFVVLLTCLIAPPVVKILLNRWQLQEAAQDLA